MRMDWLEDFWSKIVFQCSSASRKFLNLIEHQALERARECFSALQRAENSSMVLGFVRLPVTLSFSALQRAENSSIIWNGWMDSLLHRFSALQRAENSSMALPEP